MAVSNIHIGNNETLGIVYEIVGSGASAFNRRLANLRDVDVKAEVTQLPNDTIVWRWEVEAPGLGRTTWRRFMVASAIPMSTGYLSFTFVTYLNHDNYNYESFKSEERLSPAMVMNLSSEAVAEDFWDYFTLLGREYAGLRKTLEYYQNDPKGSAYFADDDTNNYYGTQPDSF